MTKDPITDNELDALLSASSVSIIDNDFTIKMLDRLEQQERLYRYIPFIFGIIGAVISSFFLPIEFMKELSVIFSSKESLIASVSSPMTLALLLSTPLGLLFIRSD